MSSRWKKGQSGNPNGRPSKGQAVNDKLWDLLNQVNINGRKAAGKTNLEVILGQLVKKATVGTPWAVQFIYERIAGKATQPTEITGAGGGAIEIVYSNSFDGA